MKKLWAVFSLCALGCVGAVAGQWTGYISDAKCATASAKAKSAAEWINPAAFESCVKKCVKEGSAVVFVTEDNKILQIDAASMVKVMPNLGHKVTVTGTMEGKTLKVDNIKAEAL